MFYPFIVSIIDVVVCSFYRMRAERIEWFADRNPFQPEIMEILKIGVFLPLKEKGPDGSQIFIIRTGAHDTKKHDQNNVLKVSCSRWRALCSKYIRVQSKRRNSFDHFDDDQQLNRQK